jgi:hypothetical protein
VKNWRLRFFTLHIKPIPILAYYRDEQKQQSPTQMLFLKGARVEVHLPPALSTYAIPQQGRPLEVTHMNEGFPTAVYALCRGRVP